MSNAYEKALTEFQNALTRTTVREDREIVTWKDGTADWIRDAIHEAHGDMGPNDHCYEMIAACVGALTPEDVEDGVTPGDVEPPIYTGQLLDYMTPGRLWRADEAIAEHGCKDICSAITFAWCEEFNEVASSIVQAIQQRAEHIAETDGGDPARDEG